MHAKQSALSQQIEYYLKYSPAVDLAWRVAVHEAAGGRSACVEPEQFLLALTQGIAEGLE